MTTSHPKKPSQEKTNVGFAALGVDPRLLGGLATLGYEEPTPIQRSTIPPLLEGRDVRGQAATGTGKTAAFALPLLQRLDKKSRVGGRVGALVLVPTRELAMQVAEAIHRYGATLGVSVLPIYGGQSIGQQLKALQRGVDVVVATPGRALDHMRRRTLVLANVGLVVLDEADEMLDMGFADDLESILKTLPETHQTALFSATMPPRILAIAKRHLKNPVEMSIEKKRTAAGVLPQVRQTAYIIGRTQKLASLVRVLDMEEPTSVMIFCRTRIEVDELTEKLGGHGYGAIALHGGLTQEQRDRVMGNFRSGRSEVLVATDVAARGLDIDHVSHVVNYDVPSAPEAYVHRIGRTGRAGRAGTAITLAEPREHRLLRNIEELTKQRIEVAAVPTVADLRAKRLDMLQSTLKESLAKGDLDRYRAVAAGLASDHDVLDIAAAALRMAHEATGSDGEGVDIPPPPPPKPPGAQAFGARGARQAAARETPREGAAREAGPVERGSGQRAIEVVKIRIACGKADGVRPGDLVGAIANEAGVPSRVIGAIEIAQHHSVVEIAADIVDRVVQALGKAKVKGKRVAVSREDAR